MQLRALPAGEPGQSPRFRGCQRLEVAPGVELLLDSQHPALRRDPESLAQAVRDALALRGDATGEP